MKRSISLVLACALLLVASVASALPLPPKGDFKRLDKMEQTSYGASLGVKGYVAATRSDGIEQFGVRLFTDRVDLRATQHFIIEATNEAGTFEIGVVEMFLGSGDLQLISSRDISEVFPLSNVRQIVVRDKTDIVLSLTYFADGTFGSR